MSKVFVFSQSCKGFEECGICSFVCPKNLFKASGEMNQLGYLPSEIVDQEECIGCENCMIYCPDLAIVVEKDPKESDSDKGDAHEQSE